MVLDFQVFKATVTLLAAAFCPLCQRYINIDVFTITYMICIFIHWIPMTITNHKSYIFIISHSELINAITELDWNTISICSQNKLHYHWCHRNSQLAIAIAIQIDASVLNGSYIFISIQIQISCQYKHCNGSPSNVSLNICVMHYFTSISWENAVAIHSLYNRHHGDIINCFWFYLPWCIFK